MDINLSLSPAVTITNKLAVRIYKASAPSVVVALQEFSPPHTSPRNITFAGVDAEVYIVNTYETVGDPVIGTLRHSFIFDPTFASVEIKAPEFLTMTGGSNSYSDPTWAGYDIELVIRNAFGPLFHTQQIDWVLDGAGKIIGFTLNNSGDTFAAGEQVTVTFKAKITTISPTIVSSKFVTAEEIITATTTLVEGQAGKLLRLQGASAFFTVSLPAIGSTATFLMYVLVSDGGVHNNVVINVAGADTINHFGDRTELILAQGEKAWILYTGSDYVVLNDCPGVLRVGEIIDSFDKDSSVQACIFADGSLLDRNTYKRLWNFVQQLDGSLLISDASWLGDIPNNAAKFSTGDGTTTFRIPRLYVDGYARGVDGATRLAGSHQDDKVLDHEHESTIGLLTPTIFGRGVARGYIGQYGTARAGQTDLVGPPVDASNGDTVKSTVENLTNNFGVYKLIRI